MKRFLFCVGVTALSLAPLSSPPSAWAQPAKAFATKPITNSVVLAKSRQVVVALKKRDMRTVATWVNAHYGLRISPQIYVQKSDVKLSPIQVRQLNTSNLKRTWGDYEGEGGPIKLRWRDYWKRFIWNRDYSRTHHVTTGVTETRGSMINNLREFYPGATLVEFYLPPSKPGELDWNSLWLVWRHKGSKWVLVGVAHNEWSP